MRAARSRDEKSIQDNVNITFNPATGIPYPFGKFDFFLVPAFQFGGMEHPGAVFYNAPALLLDEDRDRIFMISMRDSSGWSSVEIVT